MFSRDLSFLGYCIDGTWWLLGRGHTPYIDLKDRKLTWAQGCEKRAHLSMVCCISQMQCILCALVFIFAQFLWCCKGGWWRGCVCVGWLVNGNWWISVRHAYSENELYCSFYDWAENRTNNCTYSEYKCSPWYISKRQYSTFNCFIFLEEYFTALKMHLCLVIHLSSVIIQFDLPCLSVHRWKLMSDNIKLNFIKSQIGAVNNGACETFSLRSYGFQNPFLQKCKMDGKKS